jgi:uncharacterized protein (DUF58 family)
MEGGMRQQVTQLGLLFSITILLIGIAAFASANNLLFLLLAVMLSTLLVSGFISRLSLAGLELDLMLPEHISARRKVSGRIVVRNLKRWIPSFSIHLAGSPASSILTELYFPAVPGRSALEETIELYFARRGRHAESSFHVSTRFPFGFTERRAQVRLRRDVLVYPSIDAQPGFEELFGEITGEIAAHYRGRGNDFYRIRPYEVLESARHVDWKATAHTGELQVREFAREQEHQIELLLDLDVPEACRDWFEQAVECCAFLAWRIALRGARLRFRTQDADVSMPEEADVYTILKYLALARPAPGRTPPVCHDETSFRVAFSATGARLEESGWSSARVLGPDDFPFASGANAGARAGEDVHHRRREDHD